MFVPAAVFRLVLILTVLLGPLAGARAAVDPALAMARAAGSLCMSDPADDVRTASHNHCMACQALAGWGVLVAAAFALAPPAAMQLSRWPAGRAEMASRWRAYASRAPPGGVV